MKNGTENGSQSKVSSKLHDTSLFLQRGYINGEWVSSLSGDTFDVFDPASGERIATLPEMDVKDAAAAVQHAATAFKSFKNGVARDRARLLRRWRDLIVDNVNDLGTIMALENGKSIADSKAEVLFAADFFEWYAGECERTYGENIPSANRSQRIVTIKQPIGVVAALTPWNFPAAMISRKVGAASAAGCTVVFKPAGETPLTCLAIAALGAKAGVSKGVLNVVTTHKNLAAVGKSLCEDPSVRKVSFTGSTNVGKLLMHQSSSSMKKLSLELGGNSPFIIFDDADLSKTIKALIQAKARNSGQTCVCANRVYVQEGILHDVRASLVKAMSELTIGSGFESGVQIGPLMHENAVAKAHGHIKDAVNKGAKVLLGGGPVPNKSGHFLQPTVLDNMSSDMFAHSEETFAPVASLYSSRTEEEVVEAANSSEMGLGSYVCTPDIGKMWRVAEALETGLVAVNQGGLAAVECPFGGVKWSGFGKEGGKYGIEEYLVVKSVLINVD